MPHTIFHYIILYFNITLYLIQELEQQAPPLTILASSPLLFRQFSKNMTKKYQVLSKKSRIEELILLQVVIVKWTFLDIPLQKVITSQFLSFNKNRNNKFHFVLLRPLLYWAPANKKDFLQVIYKMYCMLTSIYQNVSIFIFFFQLGTYSFCDTVSGKIIGAYFGDKREVCNKYKLVIKNQVLPYL